jgi:hypothetical protein
MVRSPIEVRSPLDGSEAAARPAPLSRGVNGPRAAPFRDGKSPPGALLSYVGRSPAFRIYRLRISLSFSALLLISRFEVAVREAKWAKVSAIRSARQSMRDRCDA